GVCHQQPFSTGLARNASGALSLAGAILIINPDYQSGTSPTTGADRSRTRGPLIGGIQHLSEPLPPTKCLVTYLHAVTQEPVRVVSELEEPCLHDHSTQRHPPAKTHRQHGAYKRLQRYGLPREPHGAADEFVAPSRSKLVTPKERTPPCRSFSSTSSPPWTATHRERAGPGGGASRARSTLHGSASSPRPPTSWERTPTA